MTTEIKEQINKINAEIERYTQGLLEDEKACVTEMLTLASYSDISPETAFDCIEYRFGERARTNAEALYRAVMATWKK